MVNSALPAVGELDWGPKLKAALDDQLSRVQMRAGNLLHGLRPIATRSRAVHAVNSAATSQSSGAVLTQTSQLLHTVAETSLGFRLVFSNVAWWNNQATQYQITVTASVKWGGTLYQVTFGGRTSVVIDPLGIILSDFIGVPVTAGGTLTVLTSVTVASGAKFPVSYILSTGEGRVDGTDETMNTSPPLNGTTGISVYGCSAIVGQVPVPLRPSVLIDGDSIASGAGAGDSPTQQPLDAGWPAKALNNNFGYIQMSLYGDSAVNVLPYRRDRVKFQGTCDYTLAAMGSNDLYVNSSTLAALQASWIARWNSSFLRGSRVIQTTLTPRTTSTDTWATTANQTIVNPTQNTIRIQANNWLRDGAPMTAAGAPFATGTTDPAAIRIGALNHPLYKYLEVSDLVESARDSGLWKVTGGTPTTDGTHPSTNAVALITAGVDMLSLMPLY